MTAPTLPAPFETPRVTPAAEWMSTFLALGIQQGDSWTPIGAGVLFLDAPLVWLLTARRVLEGVGDQILSAYVRSGEGKATLVDVVTGRGPGGVLPWLRHPERDVAAAVLPVQPSWQIKAFAEARCFSLEDTEPLQPAGILCAPYGMEGPTDPKPATLAGAIARVDPATQEILTTAPLLPRNPGAPLVVSLPPKSGGGVALAGICTHTLTVPEPHQSSAAPVRLASAVSFSAALELIRGEEGRAQRQATLEGGQQR